MDDWRQKERGTREISARNTVNVFVSEEKKLSGAICLRLRIYATHRAPLWCSRMADAACLTNGGMIRPAGCRFLVDGAMSQRMAVPEVYLLYRHSRRQYHARRHESNSPSEGGQRRKHGPDCRSIRYGSEPLPKSQKQAGGRLYEKTHKQKVDLSCSVASDGSRYRTDGCNGRRRRYRRHHKHQYEDDFAGDQRIPVRSNRTTTARADKAL